jgi:hypothetical protein
MPEENDANATGGASQGGQGGDGAGDSGTGKSDGGHQAWSPDQLPEEARAYLDSELKRRAADAEAKTRTASKANAANEARDALMKQISEALGLTEGPTSAEELTKQLTTAKGEARRLRVERAIERAAGKLDADAELVEALLTKRGALKDLDPSADGFGEALGTLVADVVERNPRLKVEAKQSHPSSSGATATGGFASGSGSDSRDVNSMSVDEMYEYLKKYRR